VNLLAQGIALTLIGMGVVFASLAALMVVVQLLNRAFEGEEPVPAREEPQGAKDAGRMRLEGRDYVVQDGDVILFRFNV